MKKPLIEGSNSCEEEEWGCLTDYLTEIMKKKNEGTLWNVKVFNFGWRSLDGGKEIDAETGKQLLNNILPNTECNFKIYHNGRYGIKINNAHHDSPTWAEWYYITPLRR